MGGARLGLLLLLVVNLASRVILALQPLAHLDGLTIPDDAYLCLDLARSIAAGHGPLYGSTHTNGFQPLWVFLLTPIFRAAPHEIYLPIRCALLLLAVIDTVALYFLVRLVKDHARSGWTHVVVAAVWILNPYVLKTSLNGMETTLAAAALLATLWYFAKHFGSPGGERSTRRAFVLGLLAGLGMMARVDLALLVPPILLVLAWDAGRRKLPWRAAGAFLLAVVGANLPWLLYSYAYTGDLYQISGRAVRYMSLANVGQRATFANWYSMMISLAGQSIWKNAGAALVATLILSAVGWVLGRRGRARFPERLVFVTVTFAVSLAAAYVFYVFGSWFFDRYLFPVVVACLVSFGVALDAASSMIPRKAIRSALAVGAGAAVGIAQCVAGDARKLYDPSEQQNGGYMHVALWAEQHFPAGTRVGSSQTGALGYLARNLHVVNLDGVVNKACYESLVNGTNIEYIRAAGVEYVIGWGVNIKFILRNSKNYQDGDLTEVRPIEECRSWGFEWYMARVATR